MAEPGWYHVPGDPEGTTRYWDGQQWQGNPTTKPGAGQIYYAAPAESAPAPGQPTTAFAPTARTSSHGTGRGPSSRSRHGRLDASLKFSAVVLSILKALPLVAAGWLVYILHYQPGSENAREIRQRFDVDFGFGLKATMLVIVLIGGGLLLVQLSGAISNSPGVLLTAAGLLTLVDIANVVLVLLSGSIRVLLPLVALFWQARIALRAAAALDKSQR